MCYFLSLLVCLLAGVPCAHGHADHPATELADDHDGTEAHACSPFCACMCMTHITLPQPLFFSPVWPQSVLAKQVFFYQSSAGPAPARACWHPPRLVS
jgi:hypothetical protein